jgi:hypothetical protein
MDWSGRIQRSVPDPQRDNGEVEFSLLVVDDAALVQTDASRFQESLHCIFGCIDAGPLALLAAVGGRGRNAFHRKSDAPGRGMAASALIG